MGCWNIFQKEKHIAQREAGTAETLIPLCSYQLAPIPRLSATAAALQRNVSLAEHQVFRLLSRLCWGDRQESVANETVHCSLCWCHLAIYCPPRTLRRNFCGTIRRWANAGTERRKHTDRGFCLPCTRSFHRCAENRIIRWSALTHPAFMSGERIRSSKWSLEIGGPRPAWAIDDSALNKHTNKTLCE